MNRYNCVAYAAGAGDVRFYAREASDDEAVETAGREALRLGRTSVFVEDANGREVHDGPVTAIRA